MQHYEDFRPGDEAAYGGLAVDGDEMLAFARSFDPQPMHLGSDPIASGWFTAGLAMRMMCEGFLLGAASRGSPGLGELRWLRPVRAGDRLSVRHAVLARRPLASRPERGLVTFRFTTVNGAGEPVMETINPIMLARAHPGAPDPLAGQAPPPHPRPAPGDGGRLPHPLALGATAELGTHAFTRDGIVAFAERYDPQPFHLSEAGGDAGPFAGLSASGWHTAAGWMRCMVDHFGAMAREAARAGHPAPEWGPSPGVRALRWLRPVRPGDAVAYRTTLTGARPLASRPGWLMATHANEGRVGGELVFSFEGAALLRAAG